MSDPGPRTTDVSDRAAGSGPAIYGAATLLLRIAATALVVWLLRSLLAPWSFATTPTALLLLTAAGLLLLAATQKLVGTVLRQRRARFERRVAAFTLGWLDAIDGRGDEPSIRDPAAVAALARVCTEADSEDAARLAAVYRASGLLREDATAAQRGEGEERIAAIERLGRMRHPTSLEVLLRVTQSRDEHAARRAVAALARTLASSEADDEALMHHLGPVLRDDRFGTADLSGFVRLLGPRAGAALQWLLEPDRPPERRVAALQALAAPELRAHGRLVLDALDDPAAAVRAAALAAAAAQWDRDRIDPTPQVVSALLAGDARVRAAAAHACGGLPFAAVRDPLLGVLGDPDWEVRRNAAASLAGFGAAGLDALATRADASEEATGDAATRAAGVARAALRGAEATR